MYNVLKRGLSFFLAIAIIFSSVIVGLSEFDFNSIFSLSATASAINNDVAYVVTDGLLCNGEITYTINLKGGIGVTGAVFGARFDPDVLEPVSEKSGACTTVGTDGDEFNNFGGVFTSGIKHGTDNIFVVGNANTSETVRSSDTAYVKFTFKMKDGSAGETDIDFYCTEFVGSVNIQKNDYQVVIGSVNLALNIPNAGHILSDEWMVKTEPTVFEPGVKYKGCVLCGKESATDEIPQLTCEATTITSIKLVDDTVVLTWDGGVEGADEYAIYRRINNSGWLVIDRVDSNTTEYTDDALDENNATYIYSIRVENEAGASAFSNEVSVKYHAHEMGEVWLVKVAPTCTDSGIDYKKCNGCDHEETKITSPLGHDYSDEWTFDIAPTCTESGSKSRHCIRCADKTDVTSVSPNGHSMGDWLVRLAPTCTESGVDYKKCANCDYEETRESKPLGHNYSDEWTIDVVPTCTENGSKSHHCIVCDDKVDVTIVAATGHTSSEWINDPATCTQEGLRRKVCLVCKEVLETDVIQATGHTVVVDKAVEPTCTEDGKTEGSHCSVCSLVFVEQETVPAEGHISSGLIIDYNATCTDNGSKHIECTVCHENLLTEIIPATGHKSTDWIVDSNATCTDNGSKHKECTVCGAEIEKETIFAPGHKSTGWIIDKSANCTDDGSKHKECTVCGNELAKETIPATGHTEVIKAAVAATCTTAGKTEGVYCSVCNVVIKAQTAVPATGHKEVKDVAVVATCTQPGKTEGSHCSVCNTVIKAQQIIPANGHVSSALKYNEKTRTEYKECTVCKVVLESKYIPLSTTKITSCYNEVKGVQLKWNAVQGATSYEVYYKRPTQKDWKLIKTTTDLQYLDTDVTGNKVYQYSVKAVDEYGNKSEFSAQRECRFIETPTLLTRENAVGGVKITWSKVEGATSYRIYRRGAGTDYWFYLGDFPATLDTFTDLETANYFPNDKNKNQQAKPKSGNYYRYTVRASYDGKDSSGKDYLIYSGFDTEGLYLKYVATPKLTSISNATNGLQIKWTSVNGGGDVEYRVYRRGAGSTYWYYLGTTTDTTWTDAGVKNANGGYYRYTVRAVAGKDGKGWYSAFDTTGLYLMRLANPTLKSAVSSSAGITVKWGSIKGATSYYVYRKTGSSSWTRIATVSGNTNTTYLDKTAKKGTTYVYTVRAVYGGTTSYFNSGISCKDKY